MKIAITYILVMVVLEFFIRHYVFRWRTAMNNFTSAIESCATWRLALRFEDTMRFAKIVEGLSVSFMKSVMVLIAFLPLLWELSKHITSFPWVGELEHGLVYLALISSIAGAALLAVVGIRLQGRVQQPRVEAAYRKELVLGEDNETLVTHHSQSPLS